MKKICIFGADGRTGVELVNELMKREFLITACVYSLDAKKFLPSDVEVLKVDVLNAKEVEHAISKCNVVVSVIGHIKNSDPLMQTKGITNIVSAMQKNGLKRIISLTGTGVREEGDKPSFFDKLGNFVIKLIDRERIIDGIEHAKVLRQSGLDWTIVRVLKLGSSDKSDVQYKLTHHGPAEPLTSRKKVANILADQIDSKEWIGKSPISS